MINNPGLRLVDPQQVNDLAKEISDAGRMTIVPAPVVIFTKQDATRAARMAPIVDDPDCENVVIVHVLMSPEDVAKRVAHFIVVHHQKHKTSGEMKNFGPWKINNIPVVTTADNAHVFEMDWPV